MPITPLHFGAVPILKSVTRGCMSAPAFVLINCVLDAEVIFKALTYRPVLHPWIETGLLASLHSGYSHTFVGALLVAAALFLVRPRKAWAVGLLAGAISHVLFDALVHPDMAPFAPFLMVNPIYLDAMRPLSLALLLGLVVWGIQSLPSVRAAIDASKPR